MKLFLILFSLAALGFGQTKKIYMFYTNDVHGGIAEVEATFLNPNFPPILGGGASAAAILSEYRKLAEENGDIFLLFDSGDIFQGTPLGTKTEGRALIEYMNQVGYTAAAAGNHDFDLGKEVFINLTEQANFPILAANLVNKESGEPFEYIKPYVLLEKQGIKIGVFGISTESTENMSFEDHIKGLDFTSEKPAAEKAVAKLKELGADLIIGISHLGLPYNMQEGYEELQEAEAQNEKKESYLNAMELARYVPGIDVLFGGHIHKGYNEPWVDPVNHTICFQNYGNGGNLGMAILEIDMDTKSIAGYDLPTRNSGLLLLTHDEYWPDPKMREAIKAEQAEVEKGFDEVIGITEFALTRAQSESPMNNLICDAMVSASGADFSFTNFGGVRSDLQIGPITPRDMFKVLPFGNSIVVIRMSGSMLRELIEGKLERNRSGLAIGGGKIVYEKDAEDGDKISEFLVKNEELDPDKMYKVAMTDYLAEGNSGLGQLEDVKEENIDRTGIILREAVTQYILENAPLKIKNDGRWVKK
ncbi:MAG: bifunctional metallophosphatase/5'-nucleotidase [Calditrichaeota bacterium]|nr:MAG: bifunctional metallophosphatase/5'-nucleotidase [Calditrichota bacterium]MBL1205713.1 bifunctional metallophosphatase/5'-nucleotidase [Calditrichota bacterium]NOG45541.1 bifunctional metallophosphatase/5'-nucleotidase [Calditrichota bacterium]